MNNNLLCKLLQNYHLLTTCAGLSAIADPLANARSLATVDVTP